MSDFIVVVSLALCLAIEANAQAREMSEFEQDLVERRPAPYLEASREEVEEGIKALERMSQRMLERYESESGLTVREYSFLRTEHLKYKNQAEELRKHLESRGDK